MILPTSLKITFFPLCNMFIDYESTISGFIFPYVLRFYFPFSSLIPPFFHIPPPPQFSLVYVFLQMTFVEMYPPSHGERESGITSNIPV